MRQAEANELFEGPRMDMANLVSNTGNLILTCLFYAPLIPITVPIAFFGLILAYWVEKYNLT